MFKWLIGESKAERTPLQQLSDERAERTALEEKEKAIPAFYPELIKLTCFGEFSFSYDSKNLVEKETFYHSIGGSAVCKKVEVAVLYADYNIRYTVGDDLKEHLVRGRIEILDGRDEFRIYEFMCEEIESGARRVMRLIQDDVKKHFKDISKNERFTEMKEIVKKNQKITLEFDVKVVK